MTKCPIQVRASKLNFAFLLANYSFIFLCMYALYSHRKTFLNDGTCMYKTDSYYYYNIHFCEIINKKS